MNIYLPEVKNKPALSLSLQEDKVDDLISILTVYSNMFPYRPDNWDIWDQEWKDIYMEIRDQLGDKTLHKAVEVAYPGIIGLKQPVIARMLVKELEASRNIREIPLGDSGETLDNLG